MTALTIILLNSRSPDEIQSFQNKKTENQKITAGLFLRKNKMKKIFLLICLLPQIVLARQGGLSFSVRPLGELFAGKDSFIAGSSGNYFFKYSGKFFFFAGNIWLGSREKKQIEGICDSSFAVCEATSAYNLKGNCSFVKDENSWPLPLLTVDFREYSGIRKYWVKEPFQAAGKFYFFYGLMNNYGSGLYDYFRVGQGLASAEKIEGPYSKIKSDRGNFFFSDIEPSFGDAVLIDADGWLYIYGRNPGALYRKGAVLARVKPEKVSDRKSYFFYTDDYEDKKWTQDLPEASIVLEDANEDFSVSYNEYLKKYLAIQFVPSIGKVLLKTADYPWGPWNETYELKSCIAEDYCQNAREQPALSEGGGKKIYFTMEKKHSPYLYEVEFK